MKSPASVFIPFLQGGTAELPLDIQAQSKPPTSKYLPDLHLDRETLDVRHNFIAEARVAGRTDGLSSRLQLTKRKNRGKAYFAPLGVFMKGVHLRLCDM